MSIYTDDTPKKLKFFDLTNNGIEITANVISNSFILEDYLCTDQLNIGECNSGRIQFSTSTNLNLTGHKIRITFGTDEEYANVGTYKITYTSTKINSDVCKLTGYDAIKEFDQDVWEWWKYYVDEELFPMSCKALRDSLCNYIGIDQEEVTLINDNLLIDEVADLEVLNGRDVLKWLGQLNAVFPHSTNNYSLTWIGIDSVAKEVTSDILIGAQSFEGKDYDTADISGVIIAYEEGAIGGTAGTTGNRIKIYGNLLAYGRTDLDTIAQQILTAYGSVKYTPCEVNLKYIPTYTLGSKLQYGDKVFYNFHHKLDGSLEADIICEGNEYLQTEDSIDTDVKILKGKSNVFTRDLDTLSSVIRETKNAQSTIQQEVDTITLSVEDLTKAIDGEEVLYYTEEKPTLTNYPAWDFTYSLCVYPDDDERVQQLPAEGITFEYKDEWYKKHSRSLAYDVNSTMSYRFKTSSGAWGWVEIADSDFSLIMQKVSTLEVTTEGITADVDTIKRTAVSTEMLKSSIATSEKDIKLSVSQTYETKANVKTISTNLSSLSVTVGNISSSVSTAQSTADSAYEMASSVEQTAGSIISTVSEMQKDVSGNSSAISTLSQTASEISGRVDGKADSAGSSSNFSYSLTSTGFTLASNGSTVFACDKNGLSVVGNGVFNGTITANAGSIGNFSISDGAIKSGSGANSVIISTGGISLGYNFIVRDTGRLECTDADISGNINASSGRIGSSSQGFIISSSFITNGKLSLTDANDGIYLGISGIALGKSSVFKVDSSGNLTASSATITGTIKANAGRIGGDDGFVIDSKCMRRTMTSLSDTSHNGIYIGVDGIALGKGAFKVTSDGSITASKLTVSNAQISSIDASKITSGTISTSRLDSDVITTSNFTSQLITSGMVKAGVISASKITTGTLSADRIDSALLRTNELTTKINNASYISMKQLRFDANTVTLDSEVLLIPTGSGGAYTSVSLRRLRQVFGI